MNSDFSKKELDRAIKSTNEKSAPGRDNIEYKIIKDLTDLFLTELLKIFNWCYKTAF